MSVREISTSRQQYCLIVSKFSLFLGKLNFELPVPFNYLVIQTLDTRDEFYSRNTSCAINLTSRFLYLVLLFNQYISLYFCRLLARRER